MLTRQEADELTSLACDRDNENFLNVYWRGEWFTICRRGNDRFIVDGSTGLVIAAYMALLE